MFMKGNTEARGATWNIGTRSNVEIALIVKIHQWRSSVPTEKITIPGKFSDKEEAILLWLYEHPGQDANTVNLTQFLNPGLNIAAKSPELRPAIENTQYAIETLVEHRLVDGDRYRSGDMVMFNGLRLTRKGESEAITTKRRLKQILLEHNIPRPERPAEEPKPEF
jgi:hypothetical protein